MKEKIYLILNKEIHLPIPKSMKEGRLAFMLHDFPKKEEVEIAVKTLGKKEKVFFWAFISIFIVSSLIVLWQINQDYMIEIPTDGGQLTEGIADIPRFINPLFATGEADRDLTALIYSGLLRSTENGRYIPDLAESLPIISNDGLVYTFKIRQDAIWHDGKTVTADDVKFTIEKARDQNLKSPKRANWEGVTVDVIDSKTIQFTLKQPYLSFLENTTMGVLPKHKWDNIDAGVFIFSELNIKGVGTGPYKMKDFYRNKTTGIPEYAELVPFAEFSMGKPKINDIVLRFYPNQETLKKAFDSGEVESMNSVAPNVANEIKKTGKRVEETDLPRVLAVFYNQNQSKILADFGARKALDRVIDKKNIVDTVLLGYGTEINSPIPPSLIKLKEIKDPVYASSTERIQAAKDILSKNGWKLNEKTGFVEKKNKKETLLLQVSLATSNVPELKMAAEMVKENWESVGAKVNLQIYEKGDLDRNAIDPRKYDALFFGEIIGRDIDIFPFWHSSQRKSPGVNIALYANSKADKILENIKSLKPNSADSAKKIKLYEDFQNEIAIDIPASFIYSPHFLYSIPEKIKGLKMIPLNTSADRFLNIYEWYIDTEKIWKIFQ